MEPAGFTNGLWTETNRVMLMSTKWVILYIVLVVGIALFQELSSRDGHSSSLWISQVFAAAMLAVPAHLGVLRKTASYDATANKAFMGFVWRGIWIGVISFILPIAVLFASIHFGAAEILAWGALLLVWLVTASACFAWWGTVLPAVITDHARSFSAASIRGSQTFKYAFPRLLISFGLISFLQLLAAAGVGLLSNGDGNVLPATGGVDVAMFVAIVIAALIGAFGIVMTAVILSRSFLIAEGKTSIA